MDLPFSEIQVEPTVDGFIPNSLYPEVQTLFEHHIDEIRSEFAQQATCDTIWYVWLKDYQEDGPKYGDLGIEAIRKHLSSRRVPAKGSHRWKIAPLIHLHQNYEDGCKFFPKTVAALRTLPEELLITSTFSSLEPGVSTQLHTASDDSFYRVHFPIVIPKGEVGFQVGSQTTQWDMDKWFIINDNIPHCAYNNSAEDRIVLLIDLLRRDLP